ncbi:pyridoxamine 5'-phosphate oxidase family protein [Desulfoluna sp.]|uniref:pyridoxamine 5'-phosphate oxidase family protein n=1 Tax=Desulfoluna sp. TaxID=2045199 RepID=UPI002633DEC1|nr:pyridoxamine 5'-phosphate oxidase family protein [Desulfoluna sp.]
MFRKVKRAEKELSQEKTLAILSSEEHGVLSTIGEDGYPYGIPLNYIFHGGKIIFHCATKGHKLENIAFHKKVSFCVVKQADLVPEKFSTRFQSVIAFGNARILEGDEKKEGLRAIVQRLSPDHIPAGETYIKNAWEKTTVVAVDVEHMTGKAAPAPNHA